MGDPILQMRSEEAKGVRIGLRSQSWYLVFLETAFLHDRHSFRAESHGAVGTEALLWNF